MEPNETQEFVKAVKEEMKTVENALRTHLSDEVGTKFKEVTEEIGTLRKELNEKLDAGESAGAEGVVDHEKRLKEAEDTIHDLVLKADSIVMNRDKGDANEDERKFKGLFLKDQDELRKRIIAFHSLDAGGEAIRAISSDLFSTGGKLSAETADRFLDFVTEKTVALSRVTTRRMMSPQGHTDELTVSARRLRAASEGVEPAVANAIGTKRRTLNTVETIWAEDITLTFLEDNIEGRGAESHIAQLLGRQFGNDLNDLAWNGQTDADISQDDAFLSINDGWIKLMRADSEVNDVDASALTSPTQEDILAEASRALPVEFKGLMDLAYFVPIAFAEKYAEELSQRETGLGDSVMINGFPVMRYFGWSVIAEPHLYEDNLDRLTFQPLSNLHHGIQRQMTVDSEWKPRKRAVEFTITARNDYEYATGKAQVLVSNIPSDNR